MNKKEKAEAAKKRAYVPPAPNPPGCLCTWLISCTDGQHMPTCPQYVAPVASSEVSGLVQAVTTDQGCHVLVKGRGAADIQYL